MNTHARPVEAPEVIPERLEPVPATDALFQASLALTTALVDLSDPRPTERMVERARADCEHANAIIKAVIAAHRYRVSTRLDAQGDQGSEL